MIIGFKVTQSCAESRVVQEWNLIIESISWETKHNVVIWKRSLTETSLISTSSPQFSFLHKTLLAIWNCSSTVSVSLLLTRIIRVISVCGRSYFIHIHPISHLCFPIYWLTLGRKFSEASLEITCPTSTDFQNYLFFPPHRNLLANNCTFEKALPITTNGFAESLCFHSPSNHVSLYNLYVWFFSR